MRHDCLTASPTPAGGERPAQRQQEEVSEPLGTNLEKPRGPPASKEQAMSLPHLAGPQAPRDQDRGPQRKVRGDLRMLGHPVKTVFQIRNKILLP